MARKPEQTVFVVDDEPDMCESIGMLLDSARLKHRSYTDPAEFLRRIDPEASGCILLDVRMPRLSGLEVQQRLLRQGARQPVVFVSGHGDIPIALRAVRAGALDFIEKPFRAEALLEAVRHALEIDRLRREDDTVDGNAAARVTALSPREREVGTMVADGASSREIAERLGLSPRTVEMHRARAMKALGVKTTAEMIRVLLAARESGGRSAPAASPEAHAEPRRRR